MRAADSKPETIEKIYEEYSRTVYKYLYSLSHDPALSEDLMQETFLKAFARIDQFQGKSSLSSWLCSIARNLFYDWCRKNQPMASMDESFPASITRKSDPEVLAAVHNLEEPYREVLYLRLFGNLEYGQIADIFHRSENWVRVTFYRARQKLMQEVERNEHESE